MKKRICIIGGSGGLGSKVTEKLKLACYADSDSWINRKYEVTSLSSRDLDIRDYKKVHDYFYNNDFNVVINLSGVNHDVMLHKIDQKDQVMINYLLDVNLHGTLNVISSCLPFMRERGYGRIILISSILSTKVVAGTGLYSSCKAFLDRLVKNISLENISKGVTCNSIQLGYFDAGLTYKLPDPNAIKKELPLKRFGEIEELCSTIEFIINNEYLTGTNIPLNGGLSC